MDLGVATDASAALQNRCAVPADVAGFNRGQAADHAQQTGFPDAIGARHVQPLACFQLAIDVFEE